MPRSAADGCESFLVAARAAFASRFGGPAAFAAIAPGRVNLIGEHTDYNDGFVLPFAMNRFTAVLARRARNHSTIWAMDLDQCESIDFHQPLNAAPRHRFARYILAVVQKFKERFDDVPNLDLLLTGNLPRGSGLSSSASVEVAMATLLEEVMDRRLPSMEKIRLCHAAEQEFVGVPCGMMDMFSITMSRAGCATLLDCRSLHHESVPLPDAGEAQILVADTQRERSLLAGGYAHRRATCESAAGTLGVPSLRDATAAMIEGTDALTPEQRRYATHVVNENDRVLQAADALRAGNLSALGELMFASHASLRELFKVSTDELDLIVDVAQSIREPGGGVWGARMTGAGFGGCAILLCRADSAAQVSSTLSERFERRFGAALPVLPVSAVAGAAAVSPL